MFYCLLSRAQAMPRKRSDIEFFQQLMFGPSLASIANGHVMLQITVRSQICNLVFWENNWSDSSETQNYRFLHQDPSQYSPFKQWKCVPVMFDEQQLIEFVDMLVLLLVMITRFYCIRQMRLEMTRSILLMNENQRRQRKEILSGTWICFEWRAAALKGMGNCSTYLSHSGANPLGHLLYACSATIFRWFKSTCFSPLVSQAEGSHSVSCLSTLGLPCVTSL